MAARRGVSMPARRLGKWKATIQYFAVAAALFPPTADTPWVADAALWVAVVMTAGVGHRPRHQRRPGHGGARAASTTRTHRDTHGRLGRTLATLPPRAL